ncbi:hypothetical protein PAXRUDRAFT_303141 [Paxillus rubicundulus Ve08.2h10]|uniref:Uncharacterized protein n=1 Tax=Paxillus rubicundulus Ve08.2h10 TaxID=930991 RepID=A0A0D0E5X7_9AGAM|nr:hypothetical protein PAXRUDRAFT_303141 [Paxillus rubicundulus Ve08.2h10]
MPGIRGLTLRSKHQFRYANHGILTQCTGHATLPSREYNASMEAGVYLPSHPVPAHIHSGIHTARITTCGRYKHLVRDVVSIPCDYPASHLLVIRAYYHCIFQHRVRGQRCAPSMRQLERENMHSHLLRPAMSQRTLALGLNAFFFDIFVSSKTRSH